MANNAPYYDPKDFGCFDLATSSVDKTFEFAFTNENGNQQVNPLTKVVVEYQGLNVATFESGSGIVISGADNHIATLTMSGATFLKYAGRTLDVSCSFFVVGDVEVIFQLQIIKTSL